MLKRTNVAWIIVVIAVLVASSAMAGTVLARRDAPQEPQNRQALAQPEVQPSVIHVGTYKAAEAERLDQNKSGDPDVNEPTQSSSSVRSFATYGK